jgi:DNA-directed RNA polymerase sigma subunit (sigma70/sigma32)
MIPELPRSAYEKLIDEWIFHERNREILKRRLLDGITFERLAEEFDMSVRQIKQIVYTSEKQLFKHI